MHVSFADDSEWAARRWASSRNVANTNATANIGGSGIIVSCRARVLNSVATGNGNAGAGIGSQISAIGGCTLFGNSPLPTLRRASASPSAIRAGFMRRSTTAGACRRQGW
jgi:hypothetical protein